MINHYVFLPPSPALITNTDSDLAHFKTVSGDAYHDASTSSTNDEGGIQSLNSDIDAIHINIKFHILDMLYFPSTDISDRSVDMT